MCVDALAISGARIRGAIVITQRAIVTSEAVIASAAVRIQLITALYMQARI